MKAVIVQTRTYSVKKCLRKQQYYDTMPAYDYISSSTVQCTHSLWVSVVGPAVMVRTGRCADCVDWSSIWPGCCGLRGNLCSLFKVPTPLRRKLLRFPNVTQCTVQLTAGF